MRIACNKQIVGSQQQALYVFIIILCVFIIANNNNPFHKIINPLSLSGVIVK